MKRGLRGVDMDDDGQSPFVVVLLLHPHKILWAERRPAAYETFFENMGWSLFHRSMESNHFCVDSIWVFKPRTSQRQAKDEPKTSQSWAKDEPKTSQRRVKDEPNTSQIRAKDGPKTSQKRAKENHTWTPDHETSSFSWTNFASDKVLKENDNQILPSLSNCGFFLLSALLRQRKSIFIGLWTFVATFCLHTSNKDPTRIEFTISFFTPTSRMKFKQETFLLQHSFNFE